MSHYEQKPVRIVGTFQDSETPTGDVKRVDEYGRIWVRNYDSYRQTGNEYGRVRGDLIFPDDGGKR